MATSRYLTAPPEPGRTGRGAGLFVASPPPEDAFGGLADAERDRIRPGATRPLDDPVDLEGAPRADPRPGLVLGPSDRQEPPVALGAELAQERASLRGAGDESHVMAREVVFEGAGSTGSPLSRRWTRSARRPSRETLCVEVSR